MKIRVIGTKEECMFAIEYYKQYVEEKGIKNYSISGLYANRGCTELYRVYIEIIYLF